MGGVEMKTKITFRMLTKTNIAVLCNEKIVGQIYSEKTKGETPYPHDENVATLESIQICGFTEMSKVWACGIFHGTKDVVVRFNPMDEQYYKDREKGYKEYVDACFRAAKIRQIKSFEDWCSHMGHPTAYDMRKEIAVEEL